jgi:4-amino-4-deoxy-L-arabinose transferase-like glycosyltransferase
MKKYFLILIILLAFVLRFYKLATYPALNADEAAIGYNAYSLLLTGGDEHGNLWPIHFQSFNDYKPGLYFYVVLPFVKVIGLNEWAVRIPGAALGVLTVLIIYLLTKELFKDEKISIFSSLLLGISPWHIHFSRGGWEVNLATFLIALGVWLFLKYVNGFRQKYLYLSIFAFALSLYAYHAARVVVPLLGVVLAAIYFKDLFRKVKPIVVGGILLVALLLPLLKDLVGPAGISRAAGVGLFADPGPLNRINEQRGEHAVFTSLIPKLFHNKVVNYGLAFLENWVSHYHGEFLFLSGDAIQRNKVPETGQLYLFEIITVVLGVIFLLRRFDKSSKVVFVWLLIAPLASALTFQSPHALRAHNMVIPITIISAVGLMVLFNWFGSLKRYKNLLFILFSFVMALNFAMYLHMYWVHMAKEYPYSSQYGVKELVDFVKKNESTYKNIVVTDRYDQPYILFLFYAKYDPIMFQKDHALTPRDQFGFSTVREFDKYRFITFGKWEEVRGSYPNSLIISTPAQIPQEANIIKRIYGSNGFEYFDIVAN